MCLHICHGLHVEVKVHFSGFCSHFPPPYLRQVSFLPATVWLIVGLSGAVWASWTVSDFAAHLLVRESGVTIMCTPGAETSWSDLQHKHLYPLDQLFKQPQLLLLEGRHAKSEALVGIHGHGLAAKYHCYPCKKTEEQRLIVMSPWQILCPHLDTRVASSLRQVSCFPWNFPVSTYLP